METVVLHIHLNTHGCVANGIRIYFIYLFNKKIQQQIVIGAVDDGDNPLSVASEGERCRLISSPVPQSGIDFVCGWMLKTVVAHRDNRRGVVDGCGYREGIIHDIPSASTGASTQAVDDG